jgi:hypothetical protein
MEIEVGSGHFLHHPPPSSFTVILASSSWKTGNTNRENKNDRKTLCLGSFEKKIKTHVRNIFCLH